MKTIKDYELKGKKVIIRCDFNVPMEGEVILDDYRIEESLRTIKYAVKKGAKIILLSHLGRIEKDKEPYSLKSVAIRLSELLKREVTFIDKSHGEVEKVVKKMKNKDIVLLENTRFEDLKNDRESKNNKALAKYYASLGDIFIDDAFGCAHRCHASNVGVAKLLPNGIGLLMEKELKALSKIVKAKKPYIVILGGNKVDDKIDLVDVLAQKADYLLIGGQMAFTFLKAAGFNVGSSYVQNNSIEYCVNLLSKYEDKIILPIDIVIENNGVVVTKFINEITSDEVGYDIGERTLKVFKQYLRGAKCVFWNGPVGYFEDERFAFGTKTLLDVISNSKAMSVIGGGDTASAAINMGYKGKITHISTGGGASLKIIEGETLPALKVIND